MEGVRRVGGEVGGEAAAAASASSPAVQNKRGTSDKTKRQDKTNKPQTKIRKHKSSGSE